MTPFLLGLLGSARCSNNLNYIIRNQTDNETISQFYLQNNNKNEWFRRLVKMLIKLLRPAPAHILVLPMADSCIQRGRKKKGFKQRLHILFITKEEHHLEHEKPQREWNAVCRRIEQQMWWKIKNGWSELITCVFCRYWQGKWKFAFRKRKLNILGTAKLWQKHTTYVHNFTENNILRFGGCKPY